jgi:hypothetical protein
MTFGNDLKYLLIILLLSFNVLSQENCTNGLDDDNDGLIDFNDPLDCQCFNLNLETNTNNFIPNPSFEEYNCLPTQFSQVIDANVIWEDGIYCVNNWQAGTWGSSDYYVNTPGSFWPNIPTPLPDGQAAAGFL